MWEGKFRVGVMVFVMAVDSAITVVGFVFRYWTISMIFRVVAYSDPFVICMQ